MAARKKAASRAEFKFDLAGKVILIHGPAKGGKTTFVSSMADGRVCWITSTPGGHGFLPKAQLNRTRRVKTWDDFVKSGKWIREQAASGAKVVAVDYIAPIYMMAKKAVLEEFGYSHPSKAGKLGMSIWDKLRDDCYATFGDIVGEILEQGMCAVLIDHTTEEEAGDMVKLRPGMPTQLRRLIEPNCDYVWFISYMPEDSDEDEDHDMQDFRDERMIVLKGGSRIQADCWDPEITKKIVGPLEKPDFRKKTGGFWQVQKELA